MWDIPEDDVVVMHYRATWTDSRTGQTFEQPGVELLTFDDARIVRTEFFPHDSHALLQTLE
jgi:ketosteroid isomerase-like protein